MSIKSKVLAAAAILTLAALTAFLAPYRDQQTAAHTPGPHAAPI